MICGTMWTGCNINADSVTKSSLVKSHFVLKLVILPLTLKMVMHIPDAIYNTSTKCELFKVSVLLPSPFFTGTIFYCVKHAQECEQLVLCSNA